MASNYPQPAPRGNVGYHPVAGPPPSGPRRGHRPRGGSAEPQPSASRAPVAAPRSSQPAPAPHRQQLLEARAPARQSQRHYQYRAQAYYNNPDNSGRLIALGVVFMIVGLLLYFAGGFLFVAAYNGTYPIFDIPVNDSIHRFYWWIGPLCFFIGFFMFIVSFATFCKGLRCNRSRDQTYY